MSRPSEDDLIARHFAPLAGPGGLGLRDDAALATPRAGHDLVVTTDMLVAGVHFFADDPPGAIARKALRVNLSDLAAKGARPIGALLGLGLPRDWTAAWLDAFATGLAADVATYGCPLLGGDTVATPGPLTIAITAFGEVEAGRMVPRTGARAGDRLYVTGTIGDAALGLAIRRDVPADLGWIGTLAAADRAALLARYLLPEPRLGLGPALAEARAAMDVSDGLLGDLDKMLKLEGLTADIRIADMPVSAPAQAALAHAPQHLATMLTGGDDYEIVCAVAPDRAAAFEAAARDGRIPVTCIGIAREGGEPLSVRDAELRPMTFERRRFQHFT